MFANTSSPALSLAPVNICKLATMVPVPLPNIALTTMTLPAKFNYKINYFPILNMGAKTFISLGDQPGVMGGIVSQRFMGQAKPVTGAFTHILGSKPVTRLTSLSTQNNNNALGVQITPSQVSMLILSP